MVDGRAPRRFCGTVAAMHLDGMARARWRMQVYCLPRPDVPARAGRMPAAVT